MIPVLAFLAGFALGWARAGKRGGNRLDKLQYGAGHGIAFAIAAFALAVVVGRAGLI